MLDSPTGRNVADFKQRYQGVIGWLHQPAGNKVAVFVSNVTSSKVTFKDKADAEYYANVDAGVQFEFIPTQRAWYNVKDAVYLVQRVPARQWKRGICSDNTFFQQLTKDTLMLTVAPWTTVAFEVMGAALPAAAVVKEYRQQQRDAVALSKHFALSASKVFFLNIQIGDVVRADKTIIIAPAYHMVRQELTDVINRNNYPFKVI